MRNQLNFRQEVNTVRGLIDHMVESRGAETFLIAPETKRQLTFEGLQQQAIEIARQLRGLRLSKGEKVAFMLDNGLFTAQLVLGRCMAASYPCRSTWVRAHPNWNFSLVTVTR
jgi:acyl-CoA synthetase (AMP-forming)/AMP-acid ligase II